MSRFRNLISILKLAFEEGVSEQQYHLLVEQIREYKRNREPKAVEEEALRVVGWPTSYDPCEFEENIRFALHFHNGSA